MARLICGTVVMLLLIGATDVEARRPNVVFILTDNHGAWTLGCYGNKDIRTPHIDQLASEGMLFRRAMSSNPVCSPTRATYLTGLMPSQHGVHSFLDNKYMMRPEALLSAERVHVGAPNSALGRLRMRTQRQMAPRLFGDN